MNLSEAQKRGAMTVLGTRPMRPGYDSVSRGQDGTHQGDISGVHMTCPGIILGSGYAPFAIATCAGKRIGGKDAQWRAYQCPGKGTRSGRSDGPSASRLVTTCLE